MLPYKNLVALWSDYCVTYVIIHFYLWEKEVTSQKYKISDLKLESIFQHNATIKFQFHYSTIYIPLVSKSLLNCVTYVTLRMLHGKHDYRKESRPLQCLHVGLLLNHSQQVKFHLGFIQKIWLPEICLLTWVHRWLHLLHWYGFKTEM